MTDEDDIWQEATIDDEGLSVTTYRDADEERAPIECAESHWSWADLQFLIDNHAPWEGDSRD